MTEEPGVRATTEVDPQRGSRYSRTNHAVTYGPLVREFYLRYNNLNTRRQYEAELAALFAFAGVSHPRFLTESAVLSW